MGYISFGSIMLRATLIGLKDLHSQRSILIDERHLSNLSKTILLLIFNLSVTFRFGEKLSRWQTETDGARGFKHRLNWRYHFAVNS
jgi:hypothetical protein